MEEIWKDIEGYEGLYRISNLGNVFSLYRKSNLKPRRNKQRSGYLYVVLYKDRQPSNKLLHRLVAESFLSNPENLPVVLHLDDNPGNNCITNLQWGTQKDNMQDALLKDRLVQFLGSDNGNSKLTEDTVREIKYKFTGKRGELTNLAREYETSTSNIFNIVNNKTWSHV